MSNQQPPARPWFRLASMVRPGALAPAPTPAPTRAPAPAPTPPPAPEAAQVQPPPGPRPTFVRPPPAQTIRSPVAQPQEPAPTAVLVPPPTAATAPQRPTAVGPVPEPRPPVTQPPPASITSSVPTTPVIRTFTTSSSLPTSPAPAPPRASPPSPPPATIVGGPPPSSSVPSSPKPRLPASASPVLKPPSPKPASPSPPAPPPSPAPSTTAIARAATPTASPKIVKPQMKTPTPSPKTKPISQPPSPLTLPPAQIKSDSDNETKIPTVTEKKTVLVQETNEKPKVMGALSNGDQQRYAGATSNHSSFVPNEKREVKKDKTLKKSSSSGEFGVRVITIAGENKGAVMELSPSRKKYGYGNNPQRGWGIGEKSGTDGSSNEEEKPSLDDKNLKTMANSSIPPLAAFMNSNVQEVNNSILYNCSTNHHDPGIHLSLSRKPNGVHGINHAKNHTNGKRI